MVRGFCGLGWCFVVFLGFLGEKGSEGVLRGR